MSELGQALEELRLPPAEAVNGRGRGRRLEARLLDLLERLVVAGEVRMYCQPDAVVIDAAGGAHFVELKDQDMFRAPPFDGHGLPVRQLEHYEELRAATGLRTLFVAHDELGVCYGWLDELEACGEHFDTAGHARGPRRIYPLRAFSRTSRPLAARLAEELFQ